MTADKLYTCLSPNTITAKLTDHLQRARLKTLSPSDKHCSLVSKDDFRSGCRNVSTTLTRITQSDELFLGLDNTIFFYRNLVHDSQSCHQDLCGCECKKCYSSN